MPASCVHHLKERFAVADDVKQQLSTLRDYLRWAVSEMTRAGVWFGHGTDNAWDEALALLLPTVAIPAGCERELLDAVLTTAEREDVLKALQQRVEQRIPTPYITGEAWFAGMPFAVDQRVLIPRSPLAELIAEGFQPWLQQPVDRILDLCTGSGCIGIACAYYFDEAQVDLADLSEDTLAVAGRNIERHELQGRVQAIQSDVFAGLGGKQYDLIVSNPPYVDREDLDSMPEEYHHEPRMALGSGEDGLDVTRRILREAADHLTEQGVLIVEVGNSCVNLEAAYPKVPFTWLEFEHGGHGVFVFNREELCQYKMLF